MEQHRNSDTTQEQWYEKSNQQHAFHSVLTVTAETKLTHGTEEEEKITGKVQVFIYKRFPCLLSQSSLTPYILYTYPFIKKTVPHFYHLPHKLSNHGKSVERNYFSQCRKIEFSWQLVWLVSVFGETQQHQVISFTVTGRLELAYLKKNIMEGGREGGGSGGREGGGRGGAFLSR